MDGRWLESSAVHKKGLKRGRGGVGVRFWMHKGPSFSAVLKIVDAYGYYYVIIHRIFYLCVIYCACLHNVQVLSPRSRAISKSPVDFCSEQHGVTVKDLGGG